MSLKRTDTGEAAMPLEELEEQEFEKRSEELRGMTDNQLLKEIVTKLDKKCNNLISMQNWLIRDLTSKVESIEENNKTNTATINKTMWQYKAELHELILDERNYKEKVSREIAEAIRGAANEVTAYAKSEIDKSTEAVKQELAECAKEIKRQRTEMKEQGLLRKIFFWATPIFLIVQTALLALALFF